MTPKQQQPKEPLMQRIKNALSDEWRTTEEIRNIGNLSDVEFRLFNNYLYQTVKSGYAERQSPVKSKPQHYRRSRPHPAPKTPQECENRNCLECPLWEGCHVMEDMPMCARATYDNVAKNAASKVREEVLDELQRKKVALKDEGYWRCIPYVKFDKWIESLRHSTQEPPR